MTRKELVAVYLEANPHLNRRQKAFVHITSPVTVRIANRIVENRIDSIVAALDQPVANA